MRPHTLQQAQGPSRYTAWKMSLCKGILYESNPRMPIPPRATPGNLTRSKSRVGGNLTFVQVPVPRAIELWKKRRNTLSIPVICININRDSSVKDCFQFYFVTTWVHWSIENKNKYWRYSTPWTGEVSFIMYYTSSKGLHRDSQLERPLLEFFLAAWSSYKQTWQEGQKYYYFYEQS